MTLTTLSSNLDANLKLVNDANPLDSNQVKLVNDANLLNSTKNPLNCQLGVCKRENCSS